MSRVRPRVLPRWVAWVMLTLLVGACKHEFEPPDREARVADAAARFATVRFDTVSWENDAERALVGNEFYAARCRDCHGTLGEGQTPYAEERGLEVPSLIQPDWRLDGIPDSVRFHIFVGHAAGMPNWGVSDATLRQIDAVTFYLLEDLRPEVLGR